MSTAAPSQAAPRPLRHSAADASTRQKIVRSALQDFSELGFDGASTRAIASRAGVNQGLIPYYFGSKDVLWREAVDWAFASLHRALDQLAEEPGPDDRPRMAALIRQYVRFVSQHPEFVRLMNEEGKRDGPRTHWLVERHVRPIYEQMAELFGRAAVSRPLPVGVDPLHFHYIFVGAVSALFHQAPECRIMTGSDPSDPAVVERHADALIHLFLGEPPGGGSA